MRVLFLVEEHRWSASTRFRVRQYIPGLEGTGVKSTVMPAIACQRGSKPWHHLKLVTKALRSDLLVIQRHLYSERTFDLLHRLGRPIVYDYDDALYSFPTGQSDVPPAAWLSTVRARLHHTFSKSSHVIAGNRELADYARQFNASVSVIPTCVPANPDPGPLGQRNAIPVVGWVGRSENLTYIRPIAAALARLQNTRPFVFRVICDAPLEIEGLLIDNRYWSLATEATDIASFDVGISPLSDDGWSRGKCGFRAIQMMAVGAPAVVSPVGVHRDLVVDGVNGFWAISPSDWADRIDRLLGDAALRRRLGLAARETVVGGYSVEANLPRLVRVLRAASQDGRP